MIRILGIHHVGIRVRDLHTARAFYEKIGFAFIMGPVGPAPIAVMKHPSGVNLNLILNADSPRTDNVLVDETERHPGYTHIALEVVDLAAIQVQLERLQIPITGGPIAMPGGGGMLFVRDPDRNVLEFHMNGGAS